MSSLFASDSLLINFGKAQDAAWQVVVDGVMGGRSSGRTAVTDETIVFSGTISLQNNGGFSSLRSPWARYDLSPFSTVSIRYRNTGQTFALTFDNSRVWYLPNCKLDLPDSGGEWKTVTLPLVEAKEYQVASPTGRTLAAWDRSAIIRLGFINTGKKAGDFTLEIDEIRFQ